MQRNERNEVARAHGAERGMARAAGALAALAVLMMAAAGCGSSQHETRVTAEDPGTVIVPAFEAHAEDTDRGGPAEGVRTAALEEGGAVTGFPPDIIVTASDSVAAPGGVIEIAVEATPDVTEMSLWDGYGDRQALVYDAEARAWRVSYRVPLRLPWERAGLSVTARNADGRWCRAWVFVRTQPATPMAESVPAPEGAEPTAGIVEK